MKDKRTVWLPGFRNVVPAGFERWLEQMASEGWHIDRITQWSSFLMVFKRGTPRKYRYVYDLQAAPRKDYRAIYEEFGWEYLGRMASVYIWRKAYDDVRPEAFSDRESVIERNCRTAVAVSISFCMFFLTALVLGIALFTKTLTKSEFIQAALGLTLTVASTLYLGGVMLRIMRCREC